MSSTSPTPAATVVLLRPAHTGFEVFMVSRSHTIDAFSGAAVFPGGKVDPEDEFSAFKQHRADWPAAKFWVAAIREAFEECGILLARRGGALLTDQEIGALQADRMALQSNTLGMADFCARHTLELAFDQLLPYARWITPKTRRRQFDTWFFLASLPPGQVARHDGMENLDSQWVKPEDAICAARQGQLTLVFPTWMNLARLHRCATIGAALNSAGANPIVTIQPTVEPRDDGQVMNIPLTIDYEAQRFFISADGQTLNRLE